MSRILGYLRVSTDEQARNGESLETQREQVEAWAKLKGWPLDEVFVETGVSGSLPLADRPQGWGMLGALQSGDVVITPKLDRMFRSAADALTTLEELKAQGVALHMIDLGGDVTGNGIGKLVFTILAAVAENERDRLRERIREVKASARARGLYGGGKRPFGWDVVDGRLVANNAEQLQLAAMKGMRDAGATFRAIGATVGKDPKSVKRILDRDAQVSAA